MEKWEYMFCHFETFGSEIEREFNEFGAKGWELVNFIALESDLRRGYKVIFKRKVIEQ